MFANRQQAGLKLAEKLLGLLQREPNFIPENALVVALPRGGVPVAKEVAIKLVCPMEILVSKKIGAPAQPELAIGAVSSLGVVVLDENLVWNLGVSRQYVQCETERLATETVQLERHWLESAGARKSASAEGKWVIVVDDGIATGMTALAALRSLKSQGAHRIILATPIASWEARNMLKQECDYFVALSIPFVFEAVGQFYLDFHQVEDQEVIADLFQVSENLKFRLPGRRA